MQRISNFAHQVEAGVLAIAAGITLTQAAGYWTDGWRRCLWPAFILIAGAFLLGFMLLPHHGLEHARDQWAFIFGDPQQRQHLALGSLAFVGGAVELLDRAGRTRGPAWQFVWPAAVAVVGLMFGLHTQHGTAEAVIKAQLIHRYLGVLLVATGLLRAAEVLWGARVVWLRFSWGITMLAAALLLAAYREPPGAYHQRGAKSPNGSPFSSSEPAEILRPRS